MPHHLPAQPFRRIEIQRNCRQAEPVRQDRGKPDGKSAEINAAQAARLVADPSGTIVSPDKDNVLKEHTSDMIDGLLIKVILREASEAEHLQVEEWIKASPANQHYFEQFKKIWEESRKLAVHSTVSE